MNKSHILLIAVQLLSVAAQKFANSTSSGTISATQTVPPTPTAGLNSSQTRPWDCVISQPPASNLQKNGLPGPLTPFSYYIPYYTSQSCNIYGPTCQTGSITLNVSLDDTCQTTATTLPCSSYLASQAQYLRAFDYDIKQPHESQLPAEWQQHYGRQPECYSYSQALSNLTSINLKGCPAQADVRPENNVTVPPVIPPVYPAGHDENHPIEGIECCGNCFFMVPRVQIYYFPQSTASAYCEKMGRRIGSVHVRDTWSALPGFQPIANSNNITMKPITTIVVDGHTL